MSGIFLVPAPNVIPEDWRLCVIGGRDVKYDPKVFHPCDNPITGEFGLMVTNPKGLIPQPVGLTIYDYMFACNDRIKSVDMTGWDFSGVTSMTGFFMGCRKLKDVKGDFCDFSLCKAFNKMFAFCESLVDVRLHFCNTGKVITLKEMFTQCKGMENCMVNSLDTSSVRDCEAMFENCESLADIIICDWNAANIANADRMFKNCKKLRNVNMGFRDAHSLETVAHIFYGCKSLLSVITPAGVPADICIIEAFEGTPTTVDIRQYEVDKPKEMPQGVGALLNAINTMSGE